MLPGARGSAARCVEARLVQLGYTLTGPDDSFDSTAVAALKAFQAERGGSVNGIAWRSTLQQLGIWVDPPPAPAPTCRVSLVVKLGGIGDPARCVETRLVQLGYGLSGPDSRFDATAVTALRAFQLLSGLPSDGIGWKSTLQRLGIWTDPQPMPAPTCFVSMPVKFGTRGDPARCLESRLVQLGYSLTGPDDNFDATAVVALRAFQSRFGLVNDGVAWKSSLVVLGIWKEPVPMPPATCFTAWTVRAGDWGYPVRCVETRLVQLGFWLGAPNDTFDAYGVAALKRFQARYGLASTGVADIYTLGRLGIYRAVVAPAATCRTHFAVRLGSTGSGRGASRVVSCSSATRSTGRTTCSTPRRGRPCASSST